MDVRHENPRCGMGAPSPDVQCRLVCVEHGIRRVDQRVLLYSRWSLLLRASSRATESRGCGNEGMMLTGGCHATAGSFSVPL